LVQVFTLVTDIPAVTAAEADRSVANHPNHIHRSAVLAIAIRLAPEAFVHLAVIPEEVEELGVTGAEKVVMARDMRTRKAVTKRIESSRPANSSIS